MTSSPDSNRFIQLLVQHQHDLFRYVLPLVGCAADADDVVQETAKALWKKWGEFDPSLPFLPWAKSFARQEVLMHHRRAKRFAFLSEELIEQLADRQEEQESLARQRLAALSCCLEKLSVEDRQLLQLRYESNTANIDSLAADWGRTANVLYKRLGAIRRGLLDCIQLTLAQEGRTA